MLVKRLLYIIGVSILFYILTPGCKKEYSYEGGPLQDSILIPDSIIDQDTLTNPLLPFCITCNAIDTASFYWLVDAGGSKLCGSVTNTVVSPDRTAMTFFGPSACREDEGLIITAFFNNEFLSSGQDRFISSKASLVYYDNTSGQDKLASKKPTDITIFVDQYDNLTGIASGRISGNAADREGRNLKISGSFVIQF